MDFQKEYLIIGQICRNVCRDEDLVEDLIQEVALIWIDLDPVKKTSIHNSNGFKFWIARVVKQQWASSSSPFYTKYRKRKDTEYESWHSPVDVEYDSKPDLQHEHLQRHVRNLFPSELNIFNSYYKDGLTIMQVTEKYDVDKNFVWSTLKRIRTSLQRKIGWEISGWTVEEVTEMLAPMVGKKRLKVDERQVILDVNYICTRTQFNNVYDREEVSRILKKLVQQLKM